MLESERASHQAHVTVVQPGQHRGAMGIQHPRRRSAETSLRGWSRREGSGFRARQRLLERATAAPMRLCG